MTNASVGEQMDRSAMAPGVPDRAADRTVRLAAAVVLALLFIQFLLGMFVNLYVQIPLFHAGNSPGMGSMMPRITSPAFWTHMMLGMFIALAGIWVVIAAILTGRGVAIALAGAGFVSVLVAGYGGMSFLMFGQNDVASYLMAIGFLCAFTAYFAVLAVRPAQ